jgi:hypothetical protein
MMMHKKGSVVVPHACNLEIGMLWFQSSLYKKLVRNYLINKPGIAAHACVSETWERMVGSHVSMPAEWQNCKDHI